MLDEIPVSLHSYMESFCERLITNRTAILTNIKKSQDNMEQRENKVIRELTLTHRDYAYLSVEPTGRGHKLKPIFEGPFVVTKVLSDYLIRLRDPERKRNFQNPVHIDRLKMAHIRAPNPQKYFPRRQGTSASEQEPLDDTGHRSRNTDQIVTNHQESTLETDNENINVQPRKSKRNVRKPIRYRDSDYLNPESVESIDTDTRTDKYNVKVKRIIAKRRNKGSFHCLVQMTGEPAQNSKWMSISELPKKAQELLISRPPPLID